MPLQIQRLNLDNSWWMNWGSPSFIIDPWLIGSEIDGGSWFNEQWHATPPVAFDKIPDYSSIIITQSYPDHCHLETLALLPAEKTIYSVPKALGKMRKKLKGREIIEMPNLEKEGWMKIGDIEIGYFHPGRWIDPIYYGVLIKKGDEIVFHAPHGFAPSKAQVERIKELNIHLLITTFTHFKLPVFLGGDVNPGSKAAKKLSKTLGAKYVINTHDEEKHAKGLVSKIAKVTYPDYSSLEKEPSLPFKNMNHYDLTELA